MDLQAYRTIAWNGAIRHTQMLRSRPDRMQEDDLVNLETVYAPRKTVMVSLTEDGVQAAVFISMADALIEDITGDGDKSIDMKYTDPVFRMLAGRQYVVQREFLEMMPYYDTVTRAFERMEAEEFVERVDNREGRREIRYSLTRRGTRVADAFVQVHRLIVKNRGAAKSSD